MKKKCSKCGKNKKYPENFVKNHVKKDGSQSYLNL